MPRKRKTPAELFPYVKEGAAPRGEHERACDVPGCIYAGEFKAPFSKDELTRYRWFCMPHVRDYNANWDYFSGMHASQIEDFMKDAMFGHRPTWKINQQKLTEENLEAALHDMLHGNRRGARAERRKQAAQRQQSDEEQRSLAVLNLEGEVTLQDIKKQYKLLVKKHHPDVNPGDKRAEDRFKRITKAYHELLKIRKKAE